MTLIFLIFSVICFLNFAGSETNWVKMMSAKLSLDFFVLLLLGQSQPENPLIGKTLALFFFLSGFIVFIFFITINEREKDESNEDNC